MEFCGYCTEDRLCIFRIESDRFARRGFPPYEPEIRNNLDQLQYFEDWSNVESFIRSKYKFDDIWLFGLKGLNDIELGRLYYKHSPK